MHRLKWLGACLTLVLMGSIRGVVVALPLNAAIGAIGAFVAGVLTLGLAMDTPWAPWDPASEQLFPRDSSLPRRSWRASQRACASALLGFLISWRRMPFACGGGSASCSLSSMGRTHWGPAPRSRTDVDVVASHHRHSSALVDSPLGRRPWGHATCKTWALMSRPSPHFR